MPTVNRRLSDFDDNKIQANIALLGFKTAVAGSLAKYSLQDQIIDEYAHGSDTSGIDAGASTAAVLATGSYSSGGGGAGTGGTITTHADGVSKIHTFLRAQSGDPFTPPNALNVEYLVVGGGGSGGVHHAGGGGAGGFRTATGMAITAQAYPVVVGGGGGGHGSNSQSGNDGGNSSFNSIVSTGGGGGGRYGSPTGVAGANGGSGGGGGPGLTAGAGGVATPVTNPVQGYAGGLGSVYSGTSAAGGGGGGASTVGSAGAIFLGGYGGDGRTSTIRLAGGEAFAGGGGGHSDQTLASNADQSCGGRACGGSGGGGGGGATDAPTAVNATADTGSGGGGAENGGTSGNGADGIVIIKYTLTAPSDFTLQSADTTAEAVPTTADLVILVEDAGTDVGVVNTNIKGFVSRDSGTTFTEGVLVDEGDWGTDKRILAFHDLDISAQTSGTQMVYKITTHSSSFVFNTKIHATSFGWK